MLRAMYTRTCELHDVAEIPYSAELLDSHVQKTCNNISDHENPLVRAMRHSKQWRSKHRNIFLSAQQENTGIT